MDLWIETFRGARFLSWMAFIGWGLAALFMLAYQGAKIKLNHWEGPKSPVLRSLRFELLYLRDLERIIDGTRIPGQRIIILHQSKTRACCLLEWLGHLMSPKDQDLVEGLIRKWEAEIKALDQKGWQIMWPVEHPTIWIDEDLGSDLNSGLSPWSPMRSKTGALDRIEGLRSAEWRITLHGLEIGEQDLRMEFADELIEKILIEEAMEETEGSLPSADLTPRHAIYIDSERGSDSNPGSARLPLRTLTEAERRISRKPDDVWMIISYISGERIKNAIEAERTDRGDAAYDSHPG